MTDRDPPTLDELLAALPRDVAPPGRLWHAIVSGIARRQYRGRYVALAASMACIMVAAGMVWAVMHGGPAQRTELPWIAARAPTFDEPADAKYVAARTTLETTFRERLALLDPATRTRIEASLAVIRHAHEDIREALTATPADPALQQLFESTWHEEFDLYDHVVRATQPTVAKI